MHKYQCWVQLNTYVALNGLAMLTPCSNLASQSLPLPSFTLRVKFDMKLVATPYLYPKPRFQSGNLYQLHALPFASVSWAGFRKAGSLPQQCSSFALLCMEISCHLLHLLPPQLQRCQQVLLLPLSLLLLPQSQLLPDPPLLLPLSLLLLPQSQLLPDPPLLLPLSPQHQPQRSQLLPRLAAELCLQAFQRLVRCGDDVNYGAVVA